jgi:hypothetical protein
LKSASTVSFLLATARFVCATSSKDHAECSNEIRHVLRNSDPNVFFFAEVFHFLRKNICHEDRDVGPSSLLIILLALRSNRRSNSLRVLIPK